MQKQKVKNHFWHHSFKTISHQPEAWYRNPPQVQQDDPTCPLCLKEPETITHFLMECSVLEQTRRPKVSGILTQLVGRNMKIPKTAHEWCLTILNGGIFLQSAGVRLESRITELETACSRFCHTMHIERDTRINSMLMDKY